MNIYYTNQLKQTYYEWIYYHPPVQVLKLKKMVQEMKFLERESYVITMHKE